MNALACTHSPIKLFWFIDQGSDQISTVCLGIDEVNKWTMSLSIDNVWPTTEFCHTTFVVSWSWGHTIVRAGGSVKCLLLLTHPPTRTKLTTWVLRYIQHFMSSTERELLFLSTLVSIYLLWRSSDPPLPLLTSMYFSLHSPPLCSGQPSSGQRWSHHGTGEHRSGAARGHG